MALPLCLLLIVEKCMWCGVGVPRRSFSSSVGCIVSCGGLVWSSVVVAIGVGRPLWWYWCGPTVEHWVGTMNKSLHQS